MSLYCGLLYLETGAKPPVLHFLILKQNVEQPQPTGQPGMGDFSLCFLVGSQLLSEPLLVIQTFCVLSGFPFGGEEENETGGTSSVTVAVA